MERFDDNDLLNVAGIRKMNDLYSLQMQAERALLMKCREYRDLLLK